MKTYLILLLTIFVTGSFAQSNVVVFAPKGEKFTLFIGKTLQNPEPAARVEADNPGGPTFKLRIVFPDPSVKEVSKLVFNKPGGTMFYKLEKNQKDVFGLESTTSEWKDKTDLTEVGNTPPTAQSEKKEVKAEEPVKNEPAKSSTAKGCDNPISESDFNGEVVGISARPFEPMQLSAAKKMAETHCLLVSQVKIVIYIFDSESSRIAFAKVAYDHTYDREKYSEVKDALHTEKSKNDLDRYISEKSK